MRVLDGCAIEEAKRRFHSICVVIVLSGPSRQVHVDPKTLTRAARDFAHANPAFAVEAGLAALRWLVRGYGYEVAALDVRAAYPHTLTAAANAGVDGTVRTRIRALFDDPAARSGFVASVIGKEVGLD